MADPTVVCRSCGVSAPHAAGDPMALCPFCGAALPVTLDVREAREREERARRLMELQRVQRPEPLWVGGEALPARRRGGAWLWVLLALAAATAAFVWARGGFVIP